MVVASPVVVLMALIYLVRTTCGGGITGGGTHSANISDGGTHVGKISGGGTHGGNISGGAVMTVAYLVGDTRNGNISG